MRGGEFEYWLFSQYLSVELSQTKLYVWSVQLLKYLSGEWGLKGLFWGGCGLKGLRTTALLHKYLQYEFHAQIQVQQHLQNIFKKQKQRRGICSGHEKVIKKIYHLLLDNMLIDEMSVTKRYKPYKFAFNIVM